jgi:hypothetical protein
MATENITTMPNAEARIECALEASYELESLAVMFPRLDVNEPVSLPDMHVQKLFIDRITRLARVVMSALTDDMETAELLKIVGLEE